jgi:hypothetical protein
MAATALERGGILELTVIDADWSYKASHPDSWPDRPKLLSIRFVPGAASDKLVVCQQDDGGPQIFNALCADTGSVIEYYHGTIRIPYIDLSLSTLSAGHRVVISLWRD